MIKLCIITGSRAEYGYLRPFIRKCMGNPRLLVQVAVTGTHLSPEFGNTVSVIEQDGFAVAGRVENVTSGDSPADIARSIGLGVTGFGELFEKLAPNLIAVLGDRHEILAAVEAALVTRIPVAHFCGGDITGGAYDDAIRHSITKMSHIHFVTHEAARQRVLQLGENPAHVFNVGSLCIDSIKETRLLTAPELETQLGIRFRRRNILVTYHPPTLHPDLAHHEAKELLCALDTLPDDVTIVFTRPTFDAESRSIADAIDDFTATHPNSHVFTSLGQEKYYSMVNVVDAVIGNSSSGIYEVPSFKKPSVNIGDRQKGRMSAPSVIHTLGKRNDILEAIERAFQLDCSEVRSPYGDGDTADRAIEILLSFSSFEPLIVKEFFSYPA